MSNAKRNYDPEALRRAIMKLVCDTTGFDFQAEQKKVDDGLQTFDWSCDFTLTSKGREHYIKHEQQA